MVLKLDVPFLYSKINKVTNYDLIVFELWGERIRILCMSLSGFRTDKMFDSLAKNKLDSCTASDQTAK
jgi:hypothetical protein